MVTYFTEMRSQMRFLAGVCAKLEHTAAVFLQLAQSHTRYSDSAKPTDDAARLSQRSNSSGLNEHGIQSWDGMIDADLVHSDFTNYLNWLPVDMDATSRILETELQGSRTHHSDRKPESTSTYFQRPASDRIFEWFLWDDYYGDTNISG